MANSLQLKGRIIKILEIESGTSKAGKEWKKQSFVINTDDDFNPEICFSLFGEDKIQKLSAFSLDQTVNVSFNLSSREYNGKYYHNIDAWNISPAENGGGIPAAGPSDMSLDAQAAPAAKATEEKEDDLPF